MKAPSPNVSAGALPWRLDSAGHPQVLLVHRRKPGDWAIPKGNLDPGESAPACASRELREETGLGCRLSWALPTLEYLTRSGEAKTTYYWAATPTRGRFRANKEIDGVRWFDLPEAAAILTKPRERAIPLALAALLHAELEVTPKRRPRPVLLVRGAAATPRGRWPLNDTTRPLTADGEQVARSLTSLSSLFQIDRVLSAPARRCVDTIGPLANRQSVVIEVSESLSDGRLPDSLDLVDHARGTGTVICTHEDMISGILRRLALRDHISFDIDIGSRRGSVWVLTGDRHRYTGAHYLPMPEILTRAATEGLQPDPSTTASRGAA